MDPKTGMVINLVDLKEAMRNVLSELDHRNIDKDVKEFREGWVSTVENISIYIFRKLKKQMEISDSMCLYEVKVKETVNNTAVYRGD